MQRCDEKACASCVIVIADEEMKFRTLEGEWRTYWFLSQLRGVVPSVFLKKVLKTVLELKPLS